MLFCSFPFYEEKKGLFSSLTIIVKMSDYVNHTFIGKTLASISILEDEVDVILSQLSEELMKFVDLVLSLAV